MPWSAWQDPFQIRSTATALQLNYSAFSAEALVASDDFTSTFTYEAGDFIFTVIGYQYKVQSTWETYRTFPYPMFDLTEGVDYIEVPGSPGVFYEYESGPNIFQGWDNPPVVLSGNNDPHGGRTFNMMLQPGTAYVAGTIPDYDPDLGVAIGAWDDGTPVGTTVATPDPDMAMSFSLWPSRPPYDFSVDNSYQEYLTRIAAIYLTQLPRWRYWAPGILPLRQYPRNDGLKGGAPSARPTSRQATTARRTYL